MTTSIAIPEKALSDYKQLGEYLPFVASFKEANDVAARIMQAHNEGQDVSKQARELRLASKTHRVALDKKRKELKEDAKAYTDAVDGTAKTIREAYESLE